MCMRAACLLFGALSLFSCRAAGPQPTARVATATSSHVLPDVPGFDGGPEEHGTRYWRRTYARAAETTTVTLARFSMSDEQYQGWLRMSKADFPQADLPVGPTDGNGFYQCAANDPSRCNLLVQLRCGLHLEIRGQGIARREDADAILRGLGLPALGENCWTGATE